MRPSFLARLVNGPLFDPVVFVHILNQRSDVLFDCGWFLDLSNREILSLDAVFISHTHMNHFMGLDHILRAILHRKKPIHVYGPEGITDKVVGKLNAYTWNLTRDYPLEVIIHEVGEREMLTTSAPAREGFVPCSKEISERIGPTIARHQRYLVDAVILDHNIPCLGYVIKEPFHINIKGKAVMDLGYETGSWINRLKAHIMADRMHDVISVPTRDGVKESRVKELMDELVVTSPGQKIAYLTDIRYSEENIDRFKDIASHADLLFIEAFYLNELEEQAYKRAHLTAKQAGMIARLVQAKKVVPMHISPKYHDRVDEILQEVKSRDRP
jgi:ribonuclease Z